MKDEGLPRSCVVNLEVITTILKSCLREKIVALKPGKVRTTEPFFISG